MPKYTIKTHKRVEKFFSTHPDIAKKAVWIFQDLAQDPFDRARNFDIKRYQCSSQNHFRLRIGGYRILYEVSEQDILIYLYDADSRGSIYK